MNLLPLGFGDRLQDRPAGRLGRLLVVELDRGICFQILVLLRCRLFICNITNIENRCIGNRYQNSIEQDYNGENGTNW